jgi:ABC-type Fe3+-hydroxamate transport system substrate-binding protein
VTGPAVTGPAVTGPAGTARVVSLVPSVTETLLAWGVVPAAVTRFCEQPGLATVGGTKNPDVAAIAALRPDLVVVDREENRREDAEALTAAGLAIHVTHVRRVADVGAMLAALRAAVGLTAGPDVTDAAPQPAAADGRTGLRVWVPIWRRPWMTINDGTYGGSVLAACGVVNVFGDHPDAYPEVDIADVVSRRPDVVLAPSEPYAFGERHRPLFADVAPMVPVDGKDLFWWGVRTAPGLARLRAQLAAVAR